MIEEWTISGSSMSKVSYVLGDDVISQSRSDWTLGGTPPDWTLDTSYDTQYLLYDGHGSTRQLAGPTQSIAESYDYDGYGVMLSDDTGGSGADAAASAATRMLYAGEQYDGNLDQYYLRARYYNQNNGTFNRVDPYSGNTQDPQSLHKYAYVHNNPVNGIDPTGMFNIVAVSVAMFTSMKLRTIKLVQTYRQYSRARKMMTAVGVALVISQAAISYATGGASVELAFQNCLLIPNRKKWPNIKFEFSYRHGVSDTFSKMSKLKISISKMKTWDADGGGNVSIGGVGTFVYDFIERKSHGTGAFRGTMKTPLYKSGPLQLLSLFKVDFFGLDTSNNDLLTAGVAWELGLEVGPVNTNWSLLEIMPPEGKILGMPL